MTDEEKHEIDKMVETKIEEWHEGAGEGQKLHEYLGWTWEEYGAYVMSGEIPEREVANLQTSKAAS